MNRVVFASLTILCLLSVSSITGLIQVAKADGGTIYIQADGLIDPPTAPIYTADNITYTFTGNITADADGLVIERDNTVLKGAGYTVMGNGSGNGVNLIDRNNVTITDTNIENFDYGVYLGNSSNKMASGNNVANNVGGIGFDYSVGNSISGNNITANSDHGVYLCYSVDNCVSGNNVANNVGGIGFDYSVGNSISGN